MTEYFHASPQGGEDALAFLNRKRELDACRGYLEGLEGYCAIDLANHLVDMEYEAELEKEREK